MPTRATLTLLQKTAVLSMALVLIIFGGGWIYYLIEKAPDFTYLQAVYSVIMIITGIGSSRDAQTNAGRIFNMLLALVSVGLLVGVLGQMFKYFTTRSIRDMLDVLHDRKVKAMQGHTIICGTSQTLHELLHHLSQRENAWVIVPNDAEAHRLEAEGYHVHVDDYTSSAALERAGIQAAGCVIACADSDAVNAFVALTAKSLRKDILVIARLARTEHREKLKAAGADQIIAPAELAAQQIRDAMRTVAPGGESAASQSGRKTV